MKFALLLLLTCLPGFAFAKLQIPKNMNSEDRRTVLEILGYGSSTKILGDPYPLGGYSGVELSVSQQIIPTMDVAKLGNTASQQNETSYLELTLGKGLYYNFDLFITFAPAQQGEEVSSYGGALRWGFFEAEYLPITLSAEVGANSTSFQNTINVSAQTMDLIASFNVQDVILYFGGGTVRASGTFMGGSTGVTDSGNVESDTVSTGRVMTGLAVRVSSFFGAIELSRATQPTYALKIGARF